MPPVNRYGRPIGKKEEWAVQRQKDWRLKRWDPRGDLPDYITTEGDSHFYKWGRVLTKAYPVLRDLETNGRRIGRHWIVGGWSYDKYGLNEKEAFAILAPEGDPVQDFRPPPKRILGFTVDEWMSSIVGGADAEVIVGARAGAKVGLRVATLAEVRASLNAGIASAKIAPAEADFAAREFAVKQRELLDTAHADLLADEALGLSTKEADLLKLEGELETNARFWDDEAGGALSRSPEGRRLAREYAEDARAAARAARDRRSAEYTQQHAEQVANMEARGDNMLQRLENEMATIEEQGGTTAQQFARYEHAVQRYQKELDAFNATEAKSASEARARIKRSQKVKNKLDQAKGQRDQLRAQLHNQTAKTRQQYQDAEAGFDKLAQDYFRKSAEARTAGKDAEADSLAQAAEDAIAAAARYKAKAEEVTDAPLPEPEAVQAEVRQAVKVIEDSLRTRTASVGGATVDAKTVFAPVVGEAAPLAPLAPPVPPPVDLVEEVDEPEEDDTGIPRAEFDTALHLADVVDRPTEGPRRLAIADNVREFAREGARALVTTLKNGEQWVVFSSVYGEDGPQYAPEVTQAANLPGVLDYMLGNTQTKPPGADRFGTSLFGAVLERLTGQSMAKTLTPLHAHMVDLKTGLNLADGTPIEAQGVAQLGVCRLLSVIYDDVVNALDPEAVVKACGFGIGGTLAQLFAMKHLLDDAQKVERVYSIGAPRLFETFGAYLSDAVDVVSIINQADPIVQGYGAILGHTGRKVLMTEAGLDYLPEQARPEGTTTPNAAFIDMLSKQHTEGTPRRLQVTAVAFGALRNAGWGMAEAAMGAAAAEVGTTVAPMAAGEEVKRTEHWIHEHEHVPVEKLTDAGRMPRPQDITRGTFEEVSETLKGDALDLVATHSPKAYADGLANLADVVEIPHGETVKPWAELLGYVREPEDVGEVMGWTEGIDAYLAQFAGGAMPQAAPHTIAERFTTQRATRAARLSLETPAGFVLYDPKNAADVVNNFIAY